MRTYRITQIAVASALGAAASLASTAYAGAPGNMVDSDGCEFHNNAGQNHCDTGGSNPTLSVNTSGNTYCIANPGNTSAFAHLVCTTGDAYRGQVGVGGLQQCAACPAGGTPEVSVCGGSTNCENKE